MADNLLHILLADDDLDDCMFFKEALEEIPVATNLTTVNDGVELMQLLKSDAITLPDALYLDLNMPRKNGYDCLLEITKIEKLKQVPVIIYSTSFDSEVVNQLKEWGARYYIRKPAEFSNLKKVLLKSLQLLNDEKKLKPGKEHFVITYA
jgi:CheY-like chemotaxis protein